MATEFSVNVIKLIKSIPRGKVATYGQIAALAGKPHGARGVSWLLKSSTKAHKLPWFRVLGAHGKISIPKASKGYLRQMSLLKAEGVQFNGGQVDLKRFGWAKKPISKRKSKLVPRMFS